MDYFRPKDFHSEGRRNTGAYLNQNRRPIGGTEPAVFDPTHGLRAAGMPRLTAFLDGELQRKVLPEIVRPIRQRAIGPRGV